MRGRPYESDEQRAWFLANCTGQAAAAQLETDAPDDCEEIESAANHCPDLGVETAEAGGPAGQEAPQLAFPPQDANYHDYAEMVAEINSLVASKPAITRARSTSPRAWR